MALTISQARQAEKHRKYWQQREEEALKNYVKDEKEYDKQIQEIYQNMLDSCQKEIDAFYGKYAKKEGITIAEAKKKVSEADIKAYEAKAKKYVKQASLDRKANAGETDYSSSAFSERANEEMRLYNLTMKVNRLEMLKANIGLETIKGHAELENFMGKILQGRTKEELERQAGILGKTVRSNSKKAHAIPNASFHNATFSDRIWQYHDLMKADLSKLLQQGLIRGKSSKELAKDLKKYFKGEDGTGGAQFNCERLMRTELARVQIEAQKQSLIENGFTEYMFIVNSGCCPICYGIAKKNDGIYKIDKMQPGLNAPPIHPFCRCSIAAYEDDAEYEAWLDHLENGGTTKEWNKMPSNQKNKIVDAKRVQLKQEAKANKKTSKSSPEILENSVKDSKIELDDRFNSREDPMHEVMGSARENNKEELQQILDHLKEMGVSVKYRKGQYGYEIIGKGVPGEIVIDEDASLSAWKHEYQHAINDYNVGWSSKRILKKPMTRYNREMAAYQVEIDLAKKLGREDMVKRLEANLEKERRRIFGE